MRRSSSALVAVLLLSVAILEARGNIFDDIKNQWVPAMRDFSPDLILISAGFDGRKDDPLGRFLLEDEDFRELTARVMDVADKACGHRVVSVLEGGYHLAGLASSGASHLRALLGLAAP